MDLLNCYFQRRQDRQNLKNSSPYWSPIRTGVQKGGVLSLLQFSVYSIISYLYSFYADDLQIYLHTIQNRRFS